MLIARRLRRRTRSTPSPRTPRACPTSARLRKTARSRAASGSLPVGAAWSVPPPDPPRPAGPVRVADLPVTPRKIGDVRPIYPEIARAARVEGTVIMEAVLDTTGRVTQLRVIKSVADAGSGRARRGRQWRYTPSLYGGHPVSVLMTITVRFTLQ